MAVNTNCGKWFKGNKQRRLKAKTCNSLGYCQFLIKKLPYIFFVLVRGGVLLRYLEYNGGSESHSAPSGAWADRSSQGLVFLRFHINGHGFLLMRFGGMGG